MAKRTVLVATVLLIAADGGDRDEPGRPMTLTQ